YIEKINIVLPDGQNDFNFFGENIQVKINSNTTIINEYPIEDKDYTTSDTSTTSTTSTTSIISITPTTSITSTTFKTSITSTISITTTFTICTNYYNYNRTGCLDTVPDGYYCNSTEDKTIDKCHENCKTCSEGPTDNNNNCLTCPDTGKEYFDFGNCLSFSECSNGAFIEIGIKKCKCRTNNKCLLCNSTSTLCLGCNNENGYYAKKDDTNIFVECYNSKPDGYYLNNESNLYEPCYSKCQTCNELGDEDNNKCIDCKSEYSLIINKNGIQNCYTPCSNYFYFNSSDSYVCLSENSCPKGYKLINSTNKCIDNCANDNIYNYNLEYNNVCYPTCPEYTNVSTTNANLCELKCNENNKYFNYEKNGCENNVPEGYYCNNTNLKTIDKCHENCKTCNDTNNCLTCHDSGKMYYYLGNCLSDSECTNGIITDNSIKKCKCMKDIKCKYCSLQSIEDNLCESCNTGYYPKKNENTNSYFDCYNESTISEGFYLNTETNLYEPCYSSCKKCNELGDINENKCTSCIDGYSFIINNNNKENCYPNCSHYIYFDENGYHCTEDDNCPTGYKLIYSKNRCIDNCINDNIYNYKYLYNNVCFEECPPNTHILNEEEKTCEANLICDFYYNYEQIDCLTDIPDGFYCNSSELKTIDKCHKNCKLCEQGGTDENNNCTVCKDEGTKFFDLGNCRERCEHGSFIDEDSIEKCKCTNNIKCKYCTKESINENLCKSCNIDEGYYPISNDIIRTDGFINCYKNPEGFYLNNQAYEECYSTCKFCTEFGNEIDNKCIECISTHEMKNDFVNDKNCYEKCTYNYYYDSSNNYHCTNKDCPSEYNKLIEDKKRCIDDC
ncbi:MAG: hypothetical protein J6O56_02045, partial [Bacilli bacterium]|nr:hypothetical protein [Bacilli bacterium]